MSKKALSEAQTLEQYRVALENVEKQKQIADIMAEFGYDKQTVKIGKDLLTETRKAYDLNKQEDDESSEAYHTFATLKDKLSNTYSLHRKKARVVFRNDSLTLDKLAVTGILPKAYTKWVETTRKFYTIATADTDIQAKLARLKIASDDLTAATNLITQLEAARAEYLREKGESQDATKLKDAAFAKMDDWMREFYAVGKIALEDNPQLLEALGKFVRS